MWASGGLTVAPHGEPPSYRQVTTLIRCPMELCAIKQHQPNTSQYLARIYLPALSYLLLSWLHMRVDNYGRFCRTSLFDRAKLIASRIAHVDPSTKSQDVVHPCCYTRIGAFTAFDGMLQTIVGLGTSTRLP